MLVKPVTVATSMAVSREEAYRRRRNAPPVKAAKPRLWPNALAMKLATTTRPSGTFLCRYRSAMKSYRHSAK